MRQQAAAVHLVRASSLTGYEPLARRAGLDPGAMLQRAGIPERCLGDNTLYLSYESLFELLEASARESGIASFGAELGHAQGPAILGPLAYLMRSSSSVAEAFRNLGQYFHLHNAGADVRVDRYGAIGRISYEIKVSAGVPVRQGAELALAIGWKILRAFAGEEWQARECVFRHAPMYPLPAYRRLFGSSPRFNGEFDGYVLDARILDQPLASADSMLHELMLQQVRELNARFDDSLVARVESVIRSALPYGPSELRDVAAQLGTSARSLQRGLQVEGSSFQIVLDNVRRGIAEHYLRESDLPLTQIAQLLGYGELSNLSRAFRRWHATSPRAWRQAQHDAGRPRPDHGSPAPGGIHA